MKGPKDIVVKESYEKGGFRERYAVDHGKVDTVMMGGHKCLRFTYPGSDPYQDANGAVYDTVSRQWVN